MGKHLTRIDCEDDGEMTDMIGGVVDIPIPMTLLE